MDLHEEQRTLAEEVATLNERKGKLKNDRDKESYEKQAW